MKVCRLRSLEGKRLQNTNPQVNEIREYKDYKNTTEYKFTEIEQDSNQDDLSNVIRIFRIGLSLIEERGLMEEYRQRVRVERK